MLEEIGKLNDELHKAGILVMADGLTPSHSRKRSEVTPAGRWGPTPVLMHKEMKRFHDTL
jgi:hypothetical protein